MRIKLDENLPLDALAALGAKGHDVAAAAAEGLAGSDDRTLLRAASDEGRLLITLDVGLGDITSYPPGSHAGIVVLRLRNQSIPAILGALDSLVSHHDIDQFSACVVVVRGHLVRVRRPTSS